MKFMEKLKNKKVVGYVATLVVGMLLGNLTAPMCATSAHDGLEKEVSKLEVSVKDKNKEIKGLNDKLESASPWFEMKAEEQKAVEAENARIKAEEEAQRVAEEEEAKRVAEEELKKGYDTGIGYKDLARNPKDYVGKKVKFKGKVIQVMEGNGEVQIRLAVGGNYDNIVYCVYDSSIVASRVLEDDYITVMGLSTDLLTYKSTMGGEITIPSMLVQQIDM